MIRKLIVVGLVLVCIGKIITVDSAVCDSYISPTGSDTKGNGTIDSPYHTLRRGFNAIPIYQNQVEWHICAQAGEYDYSESESNVVWTTGHGKIDIIYITPIGAEDNLGYAAGVINFKNEVTFLNFNDLRLYVNGVTGFFSVAGETPLEISFTDCTFKDGEWGVASQSLLTGHINVTSCSLGLSKGFSVPQFHSLNVENITINSASHTTLNAKIVSMSRVHAKGSRFTVSANIFRMIDSSIDDCKACTGPVLNVTLGVDSSHPHEFAMEYTTFEDNEVPLHLIQISPNYTLNSEGFFPIVVKNVSFLNNTEKSEPDPPIKIKDYQDHLDIIMFNLTGLNFEPMGTCNELGEFSLYHLLECEPCLPGFYANSTAQATCNACEIGFYSNSTGASNCSRCSHGFVANTTGSLECLGCPDGYIHNEYLTECKPCPAGHKQVGMECRKCAFGLTSYEGTNYCLVEQWVVAVLVSILLVGVLVFLGYISRDVVCGYCIKKMNNRTPGIEPVEYSAINDPEPNVDSL